MIYQILKEAWISISAYKLRTFLTMLGILIGVGDDGFRRTDRSKRNYQNI